MLRFFPKSSLKLCAVFLAFAATYIWNSSGLFIMKLPVPEQADSVALSADGSTLALISRRVDPLKSEIHFFKRD